jgi:5-methylthioadenosine/S-adenosylhomocysteine deaminase
VLGSNDQIVLPGLFNAHYHGETLFGPGLYDTLWEKANVWFHESLVHAAPEDVQAVLLAALHRQLRSGTTGLIDFFYGRPTMELLGAEATLAAYREAGLRVALAVAVRDQNRFGHADDEWTLAQLPDDAAEALRASPVGYAYPVETVFETFDRLLERHHEERGRTRLMLAPDWTPSCSDELLRECARRAREAGVTRQIHLVETRHELVWNLEAHGKSAVRRLHDLGILGEDFSGAHGVWLTSEDVRLLAESGTGVAHNPGSNLRLTSGVAPLRELLAAGVRVAIGTDGISAADDDDLLAETRLAGLLQRPGIGAARLPSEALLTAACANGPALAGWSDVGRLVPGWQADLVLLDRRDLAWPPGRFDWADPLDLVLDRASVREVVATVVAGRVLVRERRLVGVDEDAVRRRAEEALSRLAEPPPEIAALRPHVEQLEPILQRLYDSWDAMALPIATASSSRASV